VFLDAFLEWAGGCLADSDDGRGYLLGRGVSDDQIVRHRIGYAGGDYIPEVARDPEHNAKCGDLDQKRDWCDSCRFLRWSTKWVRESEEDDQKVPLPGRKLSGCVVFPLTSYSGSLVGVQVRSLVEKEYDTFLLKRRPEGYFFGTASAVSSIWGRREVFLVEGAPDHLVLERLVAPNVLALTTSLPSREQARFIRRFASTVNMCLDQDKAGRDGFKTFFDRNSSRLDVRDIRPPLIPGCKDWGDIWRRKGDDWVRSWFSSTMGAF
jgi:DNA primase